MIYYNMAVDLSNILVIGVSSRALFDLEAENEIFEKEGVGGYRKFQQQNEYASLKPGTAFSTTTIAFEQYC